VSADAAPPINPNIAPQIAPQVMNQRIRPSINILHDLIKLVGATKLHPLFDDAEYQLVPLCRDELHGLSGRQCQRPLLGNRELCRTGQSDSALLGWRCNADGLR
jgi:hypothetical protein